MPTEVATDITDSQAEALPASPAKNPQESNGLRSALKRVPKWAYLAGISLMLIIAIFTVYAFLTAEPARLRIAFQHNFHAADISVVVDGTVVYSDTVGGGSKRRFGILDKTSASLARTVGVPTGTHSVQVHVRAPADGFDQAKVSYAEFTATSDNILRITSMKRGGLTLAFEGGAITKAPSLDPDSKPYSKSVFSVFFSVLGTMLSASISFMVQEFWRSHKQRMGTR
jgi:hypothetical protein